MPQNWNTAPLISWLLKDGRMLAGADILLNELGTRLVEAGAPIFRLRLSMRTLHPLMAVIGTTWEKGKPSKGIAEIPHGIEKRDIYLGSPFETIRNTGRTLRQNLEIDLTEQDPAVYHELKEEGYTDYYGVPLPFSDGTFAIFVFTTKDTRGFSEADILKLDEIAAVLAPIMEVYSARRVSLAVAEAYLGPRTGRRVLEGQITRGHIETINAAILMSDIRDWTGISNRLSPQDALSLADDYFEIIGDVIEPHGGEILKFMGDGVLAIFPVDGKDRRAQDACHCALMAAKKALTKAHDGEKKLGASFGIGLHFGEVLYGNIGSQTRIDFTVLGHAVNVAARIEGLCRELDEPLLFSEAFAKLLPDDTHQIAERQLRGHEGLCKIFTA